MNPKREIRRDFDLVFDGAQMRAWTETIDGVEVKFIGGTASSTAKDLAGSVIGPQAQVKMLEKLRALANQLSDANSGMTAWLNHSYKIPEDTLGAFVAASLTTRTDGSEDFIDLDIKCRVTEANPRALAAFQQVQDGIRHGWSIGAYFLDAEWMSDDPDSPDHWTLLVTDIDLLEISLVGIPANQRAWCRSNEDLKEFAVMRAEEIVKEARADAKDQVKVRSLVRRLFTAQAEALASNADADARTISVKVDVDTKDAQAALETLTATANAAVESVKAATEIATSDTTSPITASADLAPGESLNLTNEQRAALPEINDTISESDTAIGTLAADTDLAESIRTFAASIDDEVKREMVVAWADHFNAMAAIGKITERDSPDDDRDMITMAVGHLARAVGHGLCAKSATHVSKALDCLSAAVGDPVDQTDPKGDEQNEMSAHILEERAAKLAAFDADIEAKAAELAALESKVSEAASLAASITEKQAELKDLEAKIAEAASARLERKSMMEALKPFSADQTAVKPEHYNQSSVAITAALARSLKPDPQFGPPTGRDLAKA